MLTEEERAIQHEEWRLQEEWRMWVKDTEVPIGFRQVKIEDLYPDIAGGIICWGNSLYLPDERAEKASGPNLVFAGPIGEGKTHAAFAATRYGRAGVRLHAAPRNYFDVPGVRSRYISVTRLLNELRNDRERHVMDRHQDAEVLFLDDLGANRATDFTLDLLYELVDARWSNMRPTIITTNMSRQALADHIGPQIASRLCDGAHIVKVHAVGRNRRGESDF
jgi:DNA replication protein DnaC